MASAIQCNSSLERYKLAGFDVLSRIVEIVSHQSFSDFLKARVFEPLGMNDTTFWPTPAESETATEF